MKALHYLQSLGISVQFAKLPLVSLYYIHSSFGVSHKPLRCSVVLLLVDPPMDYIYLKIFINFVTHALQMEQDPTNLYFSNLPKDFDERVS